LLSYGNLTVQENLEYFSGTYGLAGRRRQEAVSPMVGVFGMKGELNLPEGQLALRFKQRPAMPCSLMHGPDVLFLNEPASGIDPIARREFWPHINAR
jgi:ABC-2 type transport system ATP-binding protein